MFDRSRKEQEQKPVLSPTPFFLLADSCAASNLPRSKATPPSTVFEIPPSQTDQKETVQQLYYLRNNIQNLCLSL